MIFHENHLLALFLPKIGKDVPNLSSAAVTIGALKIKFSLNFTGVKTETVKFVLLFPIFSQVKKFIFTSSVKIHIWDIKVL